MATLPQISKSASLDEKQGHINKHGQSVPMLKMFMAQGIINTKTLDETACDAILQTNGMLALDEITKEDLILDKIASKVDPVIRVPQVTTDALAAQGSQSTEGLVKIQFSTVILAHRSADTDEIVQELTDLVTGKTTIQI